MIKYCECMEDIKRRVALIKRFITDGSTFGREDFDYELVSLRLRKILELIAFSSLVANKQKYSQAYKEYHNHWKSNLLLNNIEKLNSDFYPKPVNQPVEDNNGVKHFGDFEKQYLTRDDFTKLMNLCSEVLHAWNPYTQKSRLINFEKSILEWLNLIQALLNMHFIRLADTKDVMLVVMSDENGKVHAYYGADVEPPAYA